MSSPVRMFCCGLCSKPINVWPNARAVRADLSPRHGPDCSGHVTRRIAATGGPDNPPIKSGESHDEFNLGHDKYERRPKSEESGAAPERSDGHAVIEARDLGVAFTAGGQRTVALAGVNLAVREG